MPNYRRNFVPGGTYFFTQVVEGRANIFAEEFARRHFGEAIRATAQRWPFRLDAIVLLPDHLHSMWTLPPGDVDYSRRWAFLKKEFTKTYLAAGGCEQAISAGRHRDGRRGVWQPKFWEHTIRDERDYEKHFDYVHYNPVKHGLVGSPSDWPHSTFARWVRDGVYESNWCDGASAKDLPFAQMELE